MFKAFIPAAIAALGLYGTAQLRGWSMFASEADEFRAQRAEQQEQRYGYGRSSGGGSGSSGHK